MTIREKVIEMLVTRDLERIMNMNDRQQREAIAELLRQDFSHCPDEDLASMLEEDLLDNDGE